MATWGWGEEVGEWGCLLVGTGFLLELYISLER